MALLEDLVALARLGNSIFVTQDAQANEEYKQQKVGYNFVILFGWWFRIFSYFDPC